MGVCGKNVHNTGIRCVSPLLQVLLNYVPTFIALCLITGSAFPYFHLYLPMLTRQQELGKVSLFYLIYCHVGIIFSAAMVYINFFKAVFTCPGYVPHEIWRHTPIMIGVNGKPLPPLSRPLPPPAVTAAGVKFGPPSAAGSSASLEKTDAHAVSGGTDELRPAYSEEKSDENQEGESSSTRLTRWAMETSEAISPVFRVPSFRTLAAASMPTVRLPSPPPPSFLSSRRQGVDDMGRPHPAKLRVEKNNVERQDASLHQQQPPRNPATVSSPTEGVNPTPASAYTSSHEADAREAAAIHSIALKPELSLPKDGLEKTLEDTVMRMTREVDPLAPISSAPQIPANPYHVRLTSRSCVRFCRFCEQYKPDRAYHCQMCRRCVFHMDHHCPWINNCVGRDNTKFFLLFTLYIPIGALHAAFTMLYSVLFQRQNHLDFVIDLENEKGLGTVLYYLGTMITLMIFGVMFGGFAGHFWWLMWRGETSISEMIAIRTGQTSIINRDDTPAVNTETPTVTTYMDVYRETLFGVDRRFWVMLLPFKPVRSPYLLMDGSAEAMDSAVVAATASIAAIPMAPPSASRSSTHHSSATSRQHHHYSVVVGGNNNNNNNNASSGPRYGPGSESVRPVSKRQAGESSPFKKSGLVHFPPVEAMMKENGLPYPSNGGNSNNHSSAPDFTPAASSLRSRGADGNSAGGLLSGSSTPLVDE